MPSQIYSFLYPARALQILGETSWKEGRTGKIIKMEVCLRLFWGGSSGGTVSYSQYIFSWWTIYLLFEDCYSCFENQGFFLREALSAGLKAPFASIIQAEASSASGCCTAFNFLQLLLQGLDGWLFKGCCSRTCASKQGIIALLMLWLSGKYILPKVLLSVIRALNDRHNCINAVDFAGILISDDQQHRLEPEKPILRRLRLIRP